MSWLSPYSRRERDIRIFQKTIEKQLFQQHLCNINIAFYQILPLDIVSHITSFIPRTAVSNIDIRREITLFTRHYRG